ncbi:hypothetical protein GCM10007216_08450 [Thalassobacillus devorans]|uniref:Uncharacterized protein n=1 Tax=Thalassobacillus devorans TaxID=279813 RepID=A0ABQ1NQ76_9BACI|nr:DUF5325 family protein [Thalassobacillus devorans]NIK27757.1 hypothetical protein [Thalassobacillus devorans]GGC80226.1 hypothetical protein GCM10007216_08450 [Thalassobacillus devorans]
MGKIDWKRMFTAFLAILCFVFVGFALGMKNFWLAGLFLLLGFGVMGFGIAAKRKKRS